MTRLSDRLLVQRVDDALVVRDESVGAEVLFDPEMRGRLVETIAHLFPQATPAPAHGHTITWTLSGGRVIHPRVTCHEPETAHCRLVAADGSGCSCESYTLEHDDQGAYHVVTEERASSSGSWEAEVQHRMVPQEGQCNIKDWLENSECVDEEANEDVDIVIPFRPVWEGEWYSWTPTVKVVG